MQLSLLIEKFKKYKGALLILIGILSVMFAYMVLRERPSPAELPPVVTTPQKIKEGETLFFLKATPPSGLRNTPDAFATVEFEFSEPIDLETVQIRMRPYLELEKRVYEHSPNKLYIWPKNKPWEEKTHYNITIATVKALSGITLEEPVRYDYYNEKPEKVYGGEDWMLLNQ